MRRVLKISQHNTKRISLYSNSRWFLIYILNRLCHQLKCGSHSTNTHKLQLGGQFNLIYVYTQCWAVGDTFPLFPSHNISSFSFTRFFRIQFVLRSGAFVLKLSFVSFGRYTMNFCFIKFSSNHCLSVFLRVHEKDLL